MIILLLIIVKTLHQFLYNLYVFQLKEYRTDRALEHIQRTHPNYLKALLHYVFLAPLSQNTLPKPTAKSTVYIGVELVFLALVYTKGSFVTVLALFVSTPLHVLFINLILRPIEFSIRFIVYELASKKVSRFKKSYGLKTIGITGSYGKTTTKHFLYHILSPHHATLSTSGSINTPLATAISILKKLCPHHRLFIAEMGAYKKGEVRQLCSIVQPDVAIVTGIGSQHLSLFGSQKNIIQAKSELLFSLAKDSHAYVYKNSKYLPNAPKNIHITYYDLYNVKDFKQQIEDVNTPPHITINMIPAILVAQHMGISNADIKKRVVSLKKVAPPKRMISSKGYNKATIIDDSYSSNPEGLFAAFEYLKKIRSEKKVIIMACLIELGPQSEKIHQQIGKVLSALGACVFVTTADYFESIKKGAKNDKNITSITNPDKIIDILKHEIDKNTTVLLEGRINPRITKFLTTPVHV